MPLALGNDPDFVAIADRDGLPAAAEALAKTVAEAKSPKKLDKALAESTLAQVQVPAKAAFGAEFELTEVGPMTACRYEGGLICSVTAQTSASVGEDDFQVQCVSKYGAKAEITPKLAASDGKTATWTISDADKCWELNGATLKLLPKAHDDLEGIGTGDDDLIAPELAGLTFEQVEATILKQMGSFKACADGATGKLVVAFHIGDDGSIAEAKAETSALDSAEAESCILERFERLKFPPPNDGYTDGTFPFTFQ